MTYLLRSSSTAAIILLAILAQGCVRTWVPVEVRDPRAEWIRTRGQDDTLLSRARIRRRDGEEIVLERGTTLRIEDEQAVVTRVGDTPLVLAYPDFELDVSQVDAGLTALNATIWSLLAGGTAAGAFVGMMVAVILGSQD